MRHQTAPTCAFTRPERRAQRPQPGHDIFNSHIPHLCILSILCQQGVALVHRNQKAGSFFRNQVAADGSLRLAPPQGYGNSFLPFMEDPLQSLAESFVQRRHLLRQIDQGTTTVYVFPPNRCSLDNASQSTDRVLTLPQRPQPLVLREFCDDLFDDGISQSFLAVEMVVERSLGDIGGGQNRIDAGALESRPVDLLESRSHQAFPCTLWITQSALSVMRA